ncbi:MAG TPA: FtsX-like permease family protein [Pirellulales bacterium]|nr:FtsX-like permease family protein [Pirellulales bacterium]
MTVLDRKLLRDLRHSGGLLLAITSIMAVGVACYVALGFAYRNLSRAQHRYYADCRMADFSLEVKKVPVSELAAVAKLPGVVEVRPRIQFFATVDIERIAEPLNGIVLSLPDRRGPTINDVLLRRGGYFTDARSNEVIVNEKFARFHGLGPGQWIHLILNNRRQELFIVGTAMSSEFTYLVGPGSIMPDPEHLGVFYLKHSYAEEVFDFDGACNQVLGLLSPQLRDRPEETMRRAELLLDSYGVFTSVPLSQQRSSRFVSNEISGVKAFGVVDALIFLAVAALVLNVLMTRLTEQQRVIVGTLKAIGYLDRQVFAHFLKFGLAVGVLGGVLGGGLGYAISFGMTGLYRKFFEFPTLDNQFYFDIFVQGVLVSLACALIGSVHGARAVLRLEPAVAMRPKPPAQGGAIWLERFGRFWKSLSFAWRMTLRNLVRQRFRTAAGVFAAAMGAGMSVNALMLAEATRFLVDFQFFQVQRSDIDLAFEDERSEAALTEARQLPGVDRAEPTLSVGCTFVNGPHSYKGGITGLARDARLTVPRDLAGRRLRIPESGLVMSRKLAELLYLEHGDLVEIRPTKGLREPRRVPVVGIADSYMGLTVYADIHYLSRLVHEELAVSGVQLAIDPRRDVVRSLYRELKRLPGVQSVSSRADAVANVMDTLIKNQRVFIGLLVLFAGVIFFGSVLNSSLIGLAERQREVATLRVLGYTEWQVGNLFLRESLLLNTLGTLAGMPLGYLLNWGITVAYDTDLFRIPVVDPTQSCLATFAIGGSFALLAHAVVQRAIFRMDWLEAMKTKE